MSVDSYDDRQLAAVLTVCSICQVAFYMTVKKPVCISCQRKTKKEKDHAH